jgi:hypothetical protein
VYISTTTDASIDHLKIACDTTEGGARINVHMGDAYLSIRPAEATALAAALADAVAHPELYPTPRRSPVSAVEPNDGGT